MLPVVFRFVRSFALCAALAGPCLATAPGTAIPVFSYSFDFTPNLPDSGGRLTDGVSIVPAWGNPSFSDASPFVGWQSHYGTVTFLFNDQVTIDSVTLYFADSDGVADVSFPRQLNIYAPDYGTQIALPADPNAFGMTTSYTFSGLGMTTDRLFLTIPSNADPGHEWVMMTEATFFGPASAIPEPSTYAAMAGVATLGFAMWRRRRRMSTV